MKNKKVYFYIWDDEDIQLNYYSLVKLPNGGQINDVIGNITLKKGDFVSIDFGRSLIKYTMSGKGPESEYPFGKVNLLGVPASIVLNKSYKKIYSEDTEENINLFMKKQKEKIDNLVPEMLENYVSNYMKNLEIQKNAKIEFDKKQKEKIQNALSQMESFFKPKL